MNNITDDYSLTYVSDVARKWNLTSLLGVLFGADTALFFFLFGGEVVRQYGTICLLQAMGIAAFIGGTISYIFNVLASESGLNIDLMTSTLVMGYRGASITSLIYAISYVIYVAVENSIIAQAIHIQWTTIPLWIIYATICVIFILITWYGMTAMNYIMWLTLPFYIIILLWSIYILQHTGTPLNFWQFVPQKMVNPSYGPPLFQLVSLFIAPTLAGCLGVADIGRFIPRRHKHLGSLLIGYLPPIMAYMGSCLLGAWFSLKSGSQTNPGIYFPLIVGVFGVLFVILSQIRINTLNMYSGSLAFATFFSRLMNVAPGRQYWIILLAGLSFYLMLSDVIVHMNAIFNFISIFLVSWVALFLAVIVFKHKLFNLSQSSMPIQQGILVDYKISNILILIFSIIVGLILISGYAGELWRICAPIVSALIAFILFPLILWCKNVLTQQ